MLACELAVELGTILQISCYAWAKVRQGGCGVGGRLRALGHRIGKFAKGLRRMINASLNGGRPCIF